VCCFSSVCPSQVKWNRLCESILATTHEGDLKIWDLRVCCILISLSFSICLSVFVSLALSLSLSLSVSLILSTSVFLSVSLCLSVCVCLSLCLSLSVCLSYSLSGSLYVSDSVSLFVSLGACLFGFFLLFFSPWTIASQRQKSDL